MEEVQLMMPSPAIDFNSESTNTTPYATAPSTPQRFPTFFYSAPTSPTHQFLQINSSPTDDDHSYKKPLFEQDDDDDDDDDFAFDFSGQMEPPSISAADELFDCGKIKPLKPVSNTEKASNKKKDFENFTWALNQTPGEQTLTKRERKKTTTTKDKISSTHFRISDILSDDETHHHKNSITHSSSSSSLTWYNKWNLKNLLLFRSASEGSARRIKEPVNKYSRIRKSSDEDEVLMKKSSFRSKENGGRRVMRKVSAHEIHYTANRAVAEEMKKKTFLPYKSGLLGCLGFHNNGGSVHEISRGINSVMKQRG